LRSGRVPLAGALAFALLCGAALAAAGGPTWASLTPAQQQALAPLQKDWPQIEANRKQKWLEMSARFPGMPADERQRVQARMAEWARLTPTERANARLHFQEARQVPAEERQARWEAYQALPEEERRKLAQHARPAAAPAASASARPRPAAASEPAGAKRPAGAAPLTAVAPRPVAPIVVQAKPGATTTTLTTKAPTPSHSQPGTPKIAATPGYVDPTTLLPKRGPQGAAVRAAASADPAEQP
jgi:hypothetical protein